MIKKNELYGEGWRYLRGGDNETASDAATCVCLQSKQHADQTYGPHHPLILIVHSLRQTNSMFLPGYEMSGYGRAFRFFFSFLLFSLLFPFFRDQKEKVS